MEREIKNIYTVKIENDSVINYLERLSFEDTRNREILESIKNDTTGDFNEEYYKWAHKEYMDNGYAFEIAKRDFGHEYLANFVKHEVDWNLDFATGIVTIKQYCDCPIEGATPVENVCECTSCNK